MGEHLCPRVSPFHALSLVSQWCSVFLASRPAFAGPVPNLIISIAVSRETSRCRYCLTFLYNFSSALGFKVTRFATVETFQSGVTLSLLDQWFKGSCHRFRWVNGSFLWSSNPRTSFNHVHQSGGSWQSLQDSLTGGIVILQGQLHS